MTAWQSMRRFLVAPHIWRRRSEVAALMGAAAVLQAGAAVGMAYVAGFGNVRDVLDRFSAPWLAAAFGTLILSFVGYYYAYRGIYRTAGGPRIGSRQLIAVVTTGFGGFLAHGGGALDSYALKASGASKREASVRVTALAGMEHGILAFIGTGAGIAVLAQGLSSPPPGFSVPWSVIPVPATALAFWLAERYRDRLRPSARWRGKLGIFLDAIHLVRELILRPRQHWPAVAGMVLFWLADAFSAWAAMVAFGFRMNGAAFLIGFGTGMIFTRRIGPLAGAGVLMVALPPTIWYSGAPFAVAVVGVAVYRVLSLWIPMPFAVVSLRTLRAMGDGKPGKAEGTARTDGESALRHGRKPGTQ